MISTVKMRFGSDIIHIRGNRKQSKALANNLKVVSLNAIGCSFGTQATRTYKFCFFFHLSLSFFMSYYTTHGKKKHSFLIYWREEEKMNVFVNKWAQNTENNLNIWSTEHTEQEQCSKAESSWKSVLSSHSLRSFLK